MTIQLKHIKADGGDYTDLEGFENGAAISSTNADPWHAVCYSGTNLGLFSKGAWAEEPSSEAGRIKIYAAPGHEHNGSWSTTSGAYSSVTTTENIKIYGYRADYFTFEGILCLTSKNNKGCILHGGAASSMKLEFKRLWLKKTHVTPTAGNVYFSTNASSADDTDVTFENCVIWRGTTGIYLSSASYSPDSNYTVRNCTIYGMTTRGLHASFTWGSQVDTLVAQNIVAGESGSTDFLIGGGDSITVGNNISTDATADDDGGTGNQINVAEADIWADAPNGDFRLPADSLARSTGLAIAAVTSDIVGTDIPQGANYNVGAYAFLVRVVGGMGKIVRSPAGLVSYNPSRLVTGQAEPTPEPSITVTSPNGSENWYKGSSHWVTWSSKNIEPAGNVKIELYKAGSLYSVIDAGEGNDGSYLWSIGMGLESAADYKIRITCLEDERVYDESDANFTLGFQPSITVAAPNGGEDWTTGTTQSITWSSTNVTGNVKIELYKGGSLDSTLTSDTANDDSYSWAISSGLTAGADYKIRITSLADASVSDESNIAFTLSEPSTITVTSPDGGEDWTTGTTQSITWSSVNLTGNVKIQLYKGGSLDFTLTSDTANTGTYSWAIASGLAGATDYKIRITSLADGTVYDESDANFTLTEPASITVTSPDGGEDWAAGTTHNITWTSVNVTGALRIYVYKGGSYDSTLSNATANDNIFSWAISSSLAAGTDYKIRIESIDDNSVYDESDANFTVSEPASITVTAPDGGEDWTTGTTQSITWSSINVTGNVKIELYKDSSLDSTLTSDTANNNSYSWAISSSLAAGTDYKVRITSLVDTSVYDESDATFTVTAGGSYSPPAVTSGLVVQIDAADPDSYDSSAPTVWTNAIDDVDGELLDGTTAGGAIFDTAGGGSLQFDGVDDSYKLVRDNSDLDSGFTVVYWVRPQEIVTGNNSYGNMFNFGHDFQLGWIISNNKLMAYGFGTSGYSTYTGGQYTYLNDWSMIAWVNQNDGVMDGFVNNIKATSPPSDFDIDTAPPDDFRLVGLGTYYGPGYNIEVTVAQSLVYDRALTDTEIGQLWAGDKARFNLAYEAPAVTSGLVVLLDAANSASYDVADPTVWTNTIDSVEGDLENGPAFDIEKAGNISFDGTDDYFKIVRDNSDLDSGFTISLWYYTKSLPVATAYFFAFGDGTAAYTGNDLNLAHQQNGQFKAWGFGSANSLWSTNSSVDNQTWCFLTFVNQNDGTIDLFVDGVKDTGPPGVFHVDTAPNDDMYLASLGGGSLEHMCKIAQTLVYDRSITDAEVTSLWEAGQERFGRLPSFTITNPAGGEAFTVGTTQDITWTSISIVGNVKIELYKGSSLDTTLSSSESNTGTYSWDVSCDITSATDYKIRITSVSAQGGQPGTVYGESKANFELIQVACYESPAVTSGLVVLLDPANSDSYDSSAPTVWTNTIDDTDASLVDGAAFDFESIGCISFDGVSDYANFPRDNSDLDSGWTMVFWYKPLERAPTGESYAYVQTTGNAGGTRLTLGHVASYDQLVSNGYGPAGFQEWSDLKLIIGDWHMVAFVNQNDGTIDGFLNNLKDSSPPTGFDTDTAPLDNLYYSCLTNEDNTPMWVGAFLESKIATVLIYDRALTDTEVGQLWAGDKARFNLAYLAPAVTSGLVVSLDVANPASYDVADPTVWTNVIDSVEASLINGPAFDIEKGGCLQFDGTNDYASLARDNSDLTDGFTVVMWVKLGELSGSGQSDQGWLMNFGTYSPEFGVTPSRCAGSLSGLVSYGFGKAWGDWCDTRVATDTWYQFVWRNNDDGDIDAWVDGVKDSTAESGFSTGAPGDNFYFASQGSGGGNPLETQIAQVLVYDRALTDTEVGELYDGDKLRFGHGYQEPVVTSGMVAKLDAADPNSYNINTPTVWTNTVDGTEASLINGPAFDPENLGSLVLDGSNDYVELDRDNSALVDGFTVVMWIKPTTLVNGPNWFASFESYALSFIIQNTVGNTAASGFQSFGYPSGYGTFYDGTTKFAADEWRQLVLVNRNDGTMDCYVNNDKDTGAKTDYSEDTAPTDALWIGTYNTYTFFEMNIAQLLMYDRPLTDAEVEDLYNGDKRRFGL
tara:strand:+ start:2200 stop:8475 length:6276 start_codon:yes stop_codon:yes gene_type:complete